VFITGRHLPFFLTNLRFGGWELVESFPNSWFKREGGDGIRGGDRRAKGLELTDQIFDFLPPVPRSRPRALEERHTGPIRSDPSQYLAHTRGRWHRSRLLRRRISPYTSS
jgi:hypothetical protein